MDTTRVDEYAPADLREETLAIVERLNRELDARLTQGLLHGTCARCAYPLDSDRYCFMCGEVA